MIHATRFRPYDPTLHNVLVLQDFYRESVKGLVAETETAPCVQKTCCFNRFDNENKSPSNNLACVSFLPKCSFNGKVCLQTVGGSEEQGHVLGEQRRPW